MEPRPVDGGAPAADGDRGRLRPARLTLLAPATRVWHALDGRECAPARFASVRRGARRASVAARASNPRHDGSSSTPANALLVTARGSNADGVRRCVEHPPPAIAPRYGAQIGRAHV